MAGVRTHGSLERSEQGRQELTSDGILNHSFIAFVLEMRYYLTQPLFHVRHPGYRVVGSVWLEIAFVFAKQTAEHEASCTLDSLGDFYKQSCSSPASGHCMPNVWIPSSAVDRRSKWKL